MRVNEIPGHGMLVLFFFNDDDPLPSLQPWLSFSQAATLPALWRTQCCCSATAVCGALHDIHFAVPGCAHVGRQSRVTRNPASRMQSSQFHVPASVLREAPSHGLGSLISFYLRADFFPLYKMAELLHPRPLFHFCFLHLNLLHSLIIRPNPLFLEMLSICIWFR